MGYFDDLSCFETDDDLILISEADLTVFENKYAINLSEDYKNILLRRNGGYLRFENDEVPFCYFRTVDVTGHSTSSKMDSFWSLEFIDDFSVGLAKEDKIPPHLLIIGEAGSGTCYLCLGISGEASGKVYTWMSSEFTDHWFDYDLDMPYTERGEVRDRSLKIADSIQELLDGLCTEEQAKAWAPHEFGE
jgi:hypothetical protein